MFNEQQTLTLKKVFEKYNSEMCKAIDDSMSNSTITFSKKFERKMSRILFNRRRFYYPLINTALKRAACFIIAIIMSFSAIVYASEPVRNFLIEYVVEPLTPFISRITYSGETQGAPSTIKSIKVSYIPTDFKQKEILKEDNFADYTFTNKKDEFVRIIQGLKSNQASYSIPANATTQQVEINGNEALYFEHSNYSGYVFSTSNYMYVVTGNISKSEILKVAKGIKE